MKNAPEDRFAKERRRLSGVRLSNELPGGLGTVAFTAKCSGNAVQVLARAKEVLVVIGKMNAKQWPSTIKWREELPHWFLDRCEPAMTREQADKWLAEWRTLSDVERVRAANAKSWSLEDWLYWMEPNNRLWTWWDSSVHNENTVELLIEVVEWPFPWGALRWLIIASGAESIEADE